MSSSLRSVGNYMEEPMTRKGATNDPNHRFMLVKLTTEVAEALEDYRYHRQREQRRRVTKRELIEEALRRLVTGTSTT